MRARRVFPLLLVLASVAVVATGCFSSKVASTTINGEITIGQGTTSKTENPAGTGGSATTAADTTETTGATTATSNEGGTTGEDSTAATTAGGTGGADVAAGKTAFMATCGGCHTLKDAGTNGQVGPNLDSLAPLSVETVSKQIANGGGAMPPKLLTGKDADNVAAYVSSVAGK
jgi:mono/diheme cytochrome c family protein